MLNRPHFFAVIIALCLWGMVAAGCSSGPKVPDLGGIYSRSAMEHDQFANPVIVIPGILGSRLVDDETGQIVWGAFGGGAINPARPEGARLVAIPMAEGQPLDLLTDNVRPDGALDRLKVSFLGIPLSLDAYRQILVTLGVGGYRDEMLATAGAVDYGDDHFTCFQFDYDWRRDNIENARRLHEFILEKRAMVQQNLEERYGVPDADIKFDIVAHSMGGLITRYFLRYGDVGPAADGSPGPITWAGAELVDRAVIVGTPSAGSALAIHRLCEGTKFAFFLPEYRSPVMGTMPSVYQLLPRVRHRVAIDADTGEPIDFLDRNVWITREWGLANPKEDNVLRELLPEVDDPARRRAIALDHLDKCLARAQTFFEALDTPAQAPDSLRLTLIAGDAEPTDAVIEIAADGSLKTIAYAPGDGTVTRASALMDERLDGQWSRRLRTPIDWDHVTFLFEDHVGLTQSIEFTDNVLYELLESPGD